MRMMAYTIAVACLCAATCLAADEQKVTKLTAALGGADVAGSLMAADELATLGPEARAAVAALEKALGSSNDQLAWRAARALGTIGPEAAAAVPALTKQLEATDPLLKAQAARALGLIGTKDDTAIAALAKAVTDEDARVRRAAMGSLRAIQPSPKVIIPLMANILEKGEPGVVMHALHMLSESGDEAIPVLLEALEHPKARYWACLICAEKGPAAAKAVPALTKVLGDELAEVRMQAAVALGRIGSAPDATVQALVEATDDKMMAVQFASIFALGNLQATAATPTLEKLLQSKDTSVAMISAWALAKISPENKAAQQRAIQMAIKALGDESPELRRAAAQALWELKADPELVQPSLLAALNDENPAVRAHVAQALASLGAKALPKLVAALKDPIKRDHALKILQQLGPEAKDAVPELINTLGAVSESECRCEVLLTLASIGPEAAVAAPTLAKMLSDEFQINSATACYALGKFGPGAQGAVAALSKNMNSEDKFVQLVSVWALLRIKPGDAQLADKAIPMLINALSLTDRELARTEAAAALGDIGPKAQAAVPALKKALDDPSPSVRAAAAEALSKIQPK